MAQLSCTIPYTIFYSYFSLQLKQTRLKQELHNEINRIIWYRICKPITILVTFIGYVIPMVPDTSTPLFSYCITSKTIRAMHKEFMHVDIILKNY